MFDDTYIEGIINKMTRMGFSFGKGLSEQELVLIEESMGGSFPKDLRTLLSIAVPIQSPTQNGKFPNWHGDIDKILRESQSFVNDLVAFDIKEGGFWHPLLGEKPSDRKAAVNQALDVIHSWPRLIPVFSHRFVMAGVNDSPVFSYHGPNDTVYYGYDMADYLSKEFHLQRPSWASDQPIAVEYWDELFFNEAKKV